MGGGGVHSVSIVSVREEIRTRTIILSHLKEKCNLGDAILQIYLTVCVNHVEVQSYLGPAF